MRPPANALPWCGLQAAFSIDDDRPLDRWLGTSARERRRLPAGWSLVEIRAAGAQPVAVFRVADVVPSVEDGEAVRRFLVALRACRDDVAVREPAYEIDGHG